MKAQNTVMFMIVAVAVTGLGTYSLTPLSAEVQSTDAVGDDSAILGHVTLTATDENGEVFAYVQTDNTVLDEGDDCMVIHIFGAQDSGGNNCNGTPSDFDIIHIGSGGTPGQPVETLTVVPVTCAGTTDAVDGTVAGTAASSGGASQVVVQSTFSNVNANIDEAALSDNATCQSGNAVAYQTFTEIVLGSTDDLTIDWTITIDGSPS